MKREGYEISSEENLKDYIVLKIRKTEEIYLIQSDMVGYTVAFTQIKNYKILKSTINIINRAVLAIKRLTMIQGESEIGETMIKDLSSFNHICK